MKHCRFLQQSAATFLLLVFFAPLVGAQERTEQVRDPNTTAPSLSQEQIRDLIREAAEKDMQNDKKQRDYTYIQREEEHKLDGNDQVKSSESKTHEIMVLYEEPVGKLIAKDDKPLSESDARKKMRRSRRLSRSARTRATAIGKKRLEKQNKEQEDGRQFVKEIADAYNFRFVGEENLEGRKA